MREDPVLAALAHQIAKAGVQLGCDLHPDGHPVPIGQVAFGPHTAGTHWVVTYVCPAGEPGRSHVNEIRLENGGRPLQTLWMAGARLVCLRESLIELADADRRRIARRGPITKAEVDDLQALLGGHSAWRRQRGEDAIAAWLS